MLNIMKYSFLCLFRNKANLFWILLFPILLGCCFKAGFSNITASNSFQAIPVAIVNDESDAADNFCLIADELAKDSENQMLTITYCSEEEALSLLEKKEIDGIFYAEEEVHLIISSEMANAQLNHSILQSIVEQYHINADIISTTLSNHPENIKSLTNALTEEMNFREEIVLSYRKNIDNYDQYYYNLIAMACLFTALAGIYIAMENEGNLSTLAARKNVSATKKHITILGELLATCIVETILTLIGFFFIILVLRIDLTMRLPLSILTIFLSTITGVSFGFFMGCIGPKSDGGKIGMVFAIVMPCCFFSGLMMGNMRIVVEKYVPIFNRINPAALISDCFYSLQIYESYDRYIQNMVTLFLLSVLFCFLGLLFTRRKRYASI